MRHRSGVTQAGVQNAGNGRRGGRMIAPGEEVYLWLLVALEVVAIGSLRHKFRRRHGG